MISDKISDITVITLTKGRKSLQMVARDLEAQTVLPKEWLVVYDGKGPFPIVKHSNKLIRADFVAHSSRALFYPKFFHHLTSIHTKYIALCDDDNRFEINHLETLLSKLADDQQYVSTMRKYTYKGNVIAVEHEKSEVIDNNNIGISTALFKDAYRFWVEFGDNNHFGDLQLQSFLYARRILPLRIPVYTVRYEVRKKRVNSLLLPGAIYETIGGVQIHLKEEHE